MASSSQPSSSEPSSSQPAGATPQGEETVSDDYKKYFVVTQTYDNGAVGGKCNYCSWNPVRTFPRRVQAHLGGVTGEGVGICLGPIPDKVKEALRKVVRSSGKRVLVPPEGGPKPKRASTGSAGSNSQAGTGSRSAGVPRWRQLTFTRGAEAMEKLEVDQQVARFCYGTGIPFNALQSPYFDALCASIANFGKKHNGQYKPPSRYALRSTLLEAEKSKLQNVMESLRGDQEDFALTICTDAYTSKAGTQYMNFVAVSVNGMEFLFCEDTTTVEKKTAEYIADLLSRAIEMVGPKNVMQTCTDNASACLAAGRIVMERYPHITHTPCTSHCLDLLLEDWGELQFAKELCAKAASIIKLVGRYGQLRRVFKAASKQHCNNLEFVKPVATRFGTQFLMLARLLKLKAAVRLTAAHPGWEVAVDRSSDELAEDLQEAIASKKFWDDIELVLGMMEPVFALLRLTDGEGPCMGKVYWHMFNVQQHISGVIDAAGEGGVSVDRDAMDARWGQRWQSMHSPLHGCGYALEPEHRKDKWNRNQEVMDNYRVVAKKVLGADLVGKAVEQLLKYKQAVLSPEAEQAAKEVHGYQWWAAWGAEWPLPQLLAMKVLSLCSSATSCERVWSTYGFLGSARRGKLTSSRLSDLVYCFTNLKVVEKASKPDGFEKLVPQWWVERKRVNAAGDGEEADDEESEGSSESESDDEREQVMFSW